MKRLLLLALLACLAPVIWFVVEYYRPTVRYEMKRR